MAIRHPRRRQHLAATLASALLLGACASAPSADPAPSGGVVQQKADRQGDRVGGMVDQKVDERTDQAVDSVWTRLMSAIFGN